MKQLRRAVLGGACSMFLLFAGAQSAGAYGNSGPAKQTYQIAFSMNCNNQSFCGDGLGGFWGWAVLYNDGTGDAELTGCSHLIGGGGRGTAGAQHFHDDFTYDLSNTTELVTLSETETFVGHGTPVTETVPGADTGIPLIPGHYNTSDLLGFTAPPGVAFVIQVVALH
jgi:hypothetical protein